MQFPVVSDMYFEAPVTIDPVFGFDPVEGDGFYERSTLRDTNAGTYRCDVCGFTGYY